MKSILVVSLIIGLFACNNTKVQHNKQTAASLFMKSDKKQVPEIVSEQPERYDEVGHHGPAIENEFYALRLYFNNSGSIDVYSKSQQRLELSETEWYPDSLMQMQGYGSDQYKVGKTVGLGGIKLWDGTNVLDLVATKGRIARVTDNDSTSSMEMIAKGVAYKNDTVDIKIKVTVWGGNRMARVEASELNNKDVQFATGINHHPGNQFINENGYAIVWGKHPEDVAINPGEIGSAIIYDPALMDTIQNRDDQLLLISKPMHYLSTEITTVSERESEINTLPLLEDFVKQQVKK